MDVTECKQCGEPIFWAKHNTKDSNMPFDAEPETGPLGLWVLFEKEGVLKCRYARPDGTSDRWSSHFETCEKKEGRGPHTRASHSATSSAVAKRDAPQVAARPVVIEKKLAAVEVTVTFGDLIFSGTCTLVPKLEDSQAFHIGNAQEDIRAGDAIAIDPKTGRARRAYSDADEDAPPEDEAVDYPEDL